MLKLVKMNRTSIVFIMLVVVLVLGSVYNSFMTIEPLKFNIYGLDGKFVDSSVFLSELDIMQLYINEPSVGRIEVTSPKSEGSKFYNKLLNKKAKIGSGALTLGTLDGELYFLDDGTPIIFGNEILMATHKECLNDWKKLDGRKFPMGVIIEDYEMGLPTYCGEDEVDRYFAYVSYPTFVKNMERGYIDTSYHTIRYFDEGMMYKFLDIYNATKGIPNNKDMMKVYNKIVEKGKQNQRYYIDMYVYSGKMGTDTQKKELSREFDIYAYLFKMTRSDLQKLIKECGGVIDDKLSKSLSNPEVDILLPFQFAPSQPERIKLKQNKLNSLRHLYTTNKKEYNKQVNEVLSKTFVSIFDFNDALNYDDGSMKYRIPIERELEKYNFEKMEISLTAKGDNVIRMSPYNAENKQFLVVNVTNKTVKTYLSKNPKNIITVASGLDIKKGMSLSNLEMNMTSYKKLYDIWGEDTMMYVIDRIHPLLYLEFKKEP